MEDVEEKNCPECGAKMLIGRRKDMSKLPVLYPEAWLEGAPKKGWMGYSSFSPALGKGIEKIVLTYACPNCGRLVSYLLNKESIQGRTP